VGARLSIVIKAARRGDLLAGQGNAIHAHQFKSGAPGNVTSEPCRAC
jgi:hypothetical protein